MDSKYHTEADSLITWIKVPENFNVLQWAGENSISKKEMFEMAGQDLVFGKAMDLAMTIQEYKISMGALSGALNNSTAIKLLETYHDWKLDTGVGTKSEYQRMIDEAAKRAKGMMDSDEASP